MLPGTFGKATRNLGLILACCGCNDSTGGPGPSPGPGEMRLASVAFTESPDVERLARHLDITLWGFDVEIPEPPTAPGTSAWRLYEDVQVWVDGVRVKVRKGAGPMGSTSRFTGPIRSRLRIGMQELVSSGEDGQFRVTSQWEPPITWGSAGSGSADGLAVQFAHLFSRALLVVPHQHGGENIMVASFGPSRVVSATEPRVICGIFWGGGSSQDLLEWAKSARVALTYSVWIGTE